MVQKQRARKGRGGVKVAEPGTMQKTKKRPDDATRKLMGELSYHIKDYRTLPVDDPRRVEIERTLAGLRQVERKHVVGGFNDDRRKQRRMG